MCYDVVNHVTIHLPTQEPAESSTYPASQTHVELEESQIEFVINEQSPSPVQASPRAMAKYFKVIH